MSTHKLTTVVLLGALLSAGCGNDSTAPAEPQTQAATDVLAVNPQGGATDVDPNAPISIRFNGAMMAGMEQYVDLHRGEITGPIHPIACGWSADYASLTCEPASPLDRGTRYTLHLGGRMMGSDGAPIHMDPSTWHGTWAEPGTPMGPGTMGGPMMGGTHAGDSWGTMGPGWGHANGTYGMVFQFRTR
jgi:hypothetical protein